MDNSFKLITGSKTFTLLSDFPYFSEIDQNIYNTIINKREYYVKSQTKEKYLKSFINYWIYKEVPSISKDNITYYEELSQEFDLMKEIIAIYKKKKQNAEISALVSKNYKYLHKIQEKRQKVKQITENYKQIIEILLKNNEIGINKDLDKYQACKKSNFEKLKFLMQEKVEESGLLFCLDESEKTASVFKCLTDKSDIFIPRSIRHKSQEYVVTSIGRDSFFSKRKIQTVTFSEQSELKTIESNSFQNSSIVRIRIPSTVRKISECAFYFCLKLKTIEFSEDSELLSIGTSAFEHTAIEDITIPRHVTQIDCSAFNSTSNLKSITFSEPSELQSIENYAFYNSTLESISIPPRVRRIGRGAFEKCAQLKSFNCSENSELILIGQDAFQFNSIENSKLEFISIPSSVAILEKRWFCDFLNLNVIKIIENETRNIKKYQDLFLLGKTDTKSDIFDVILLANKDIENVKIPFFIKKIESNAFARCEQLKTVEFTENSELECIETNSFLFSSIESLTIPSSVIQLKNLCFSGARNLNVIKIIPKKIQNFIVYDDDFILGKTDRKSDNFDILVFARRNIQVARIPSFVRKIAPHAFDSNECIQKVEFSEDSQLEIIDKYAFNESSIESISIPQHVKCIGKSAFFYSNLSIVHFPENSELEFIDKAAFQACKIKKIKIPQSVAYIGCYSFSECFQLKEFEFSEPSKLRIIENNLFSSSYIQKVRIPSTVTCISYSAFLECPNLQAIEFSSDSDLERINSLAFMDSSIREISIPSKLTVIGESALSECHNLTVVNFLKNSELKKIKKCAFTGSSITSVVIPSNVTEIEDYAFHFCENLQIVELETDSQIESIERNVFENTPNVFIMIPNEKKTQIKFVQNNNCGPPLRS